MPFWVTGVMALKEHWGENSKEEAASFWHYPFIHLLNKHLLRTYNTLGAFLDAADRVVNHCLHAILF